MSYADKCTLISIVMASLSYGGTVFMFKNTISLVYVCTYMCARERENGRGGKINTVLAR